MADLNLERLQARKVAALLKNGGEMFGVTALVLMPNGDLAKIDPSGKTTWSKPPCTTPNS